MEQRDGIVYEDAELRVRQTESGGQMLEGWSPIYNRESQVIREGGREFVEVVRPGAVTRSLASGAEVRARIEHQGGLLTIGSTAADPPTLRLFESDQGVRYEVDLPDTSAARDVAVLVGRGDMRGSSFAFRVHGPAGQRWSEMEDGLWLRELLDIDMADVAPTGDPAYVDAGVKVRALEQAIEDRSFVAVHRHRHRIRHLEIDKALTRTR